MNAKEPTSARQASYLTPEVDRIISDHAVDLEIASTNLFFTKFAAERSTSSIYVLSASNTDGKSIDAFFMPAILSFGGYGIWHSTAKFSELDHDPDMATTVCATVWFGSEGFKSKTDIQFTVESRNFLTLVKHALATYTELTGMTLTPRTIIRKVA